MEETLSGLLVEGVWVPLGGACAVAGCPRQQPPVSVCVFGTPVGLISLGERPSLAGIAIAEVSFQYNSDNKNAKQLMKESPFSSSLHLKNTCNCVIRKVPHFLIERTNPDDVSDDVTCTRGQNVVNRPVSSENFLALRRNHEIRVFFFFFH